MAEIKLRPYQEKFIADIRNEFKRGFKRVVGVAPCGAGKTIITGWMIRESLNRRNRSVFFVHRKELIEQTAATFNALDIPFGIICAGYKPHYNEPVQIASVQTLVNRMDKIFPPDFLICDECHHILADTYKQIINYWKDAFLLGVTATPIRLGGKNLGDIFDSMVVGTSTRELIEMRNLSPFDYYAPAVNIKLDDVKVIHGEYDKKPLASMMCAPAVSEKIVENFYKYAPNKKAICYCVNVAHSQELMNTFNAAHIAAAHCDGTTPKEERTRIIEDFRRGKYQVLCNAELFGEGFDVPNCHAVILARPTKSLALFIQQSMRPMRIDPADPSKVATILDCVGNHTRHGLPDTPREWSLDMKIDDGKNKAPTKTCPQCFKVVPINLMECPHCGFKFQSRNIEAKSSGTMTKIKSADSKVDVPPQQTTVIHAPTFAEKFEHLQYVCAQRGYKKGWLYYQATDIARSFEDYVTIEKFFGYKSGWAYHRAKELGIKIPEKKVEKKPASW